jgi:hypothetical protein
MMLHNDESHRLAAESGEIQGDALYEGEGFDIDLLHLPDGAHYFAVRSHDRLVSIWLEPALLRELDYSLEMALGGSAEAGDERVSVQFVPGEPPFWDIEINLGDGPVPFFTMALDADEMEELHFGCKATRPVMVDLPIQIEDESAE